MRRGLWALAAVVLLPFAIFEAVKYGGFAWAALGLGLIGPDLVFLAGIGAPVSASAVASQGHSGGVLPTRIVAAYNLVHRPLLPFILLVAASFAPISHASFVPWFVLGLAWLAHIAIDRVCGFGLRNPDGTLPARGAGRGVRESAMS
ncbi:DUF4260 family protein [Dermacoccaceae bacterium W4C1]